VPSIAELPVIVSSPDRAHAEVTRPMVNSGASAKLRRASGPRPIRRGHHGADVHLESCDAYAEC
jgi:hypothetical protein